MTYDFYVRNKDDLIEAVQTYGIVPYFFYSIPGFSLEERCDPKALWSETGDDSWSWKGPVIQATHCAYGKFFEKKAAYVSYDVFLDLANYRRDGYDFDARWDDGLVKYADKELYNLIDSKAPVLSKELRQSGGYAYNGRWQKVDGKKGFDTSITRLQEQCYVIISDFVYTLDKHGLQHGWGVAQYNTPEEWFGESFSEHVYLHDPAESYERLFNLLRGFFPAADEKTLKKVLK